MTSFWKLSPQERLILDAFGGERVVAVSPIMVRLFRGNGSAAIWCSQSLYWQRRCVNQDGFWYNTQAELEEQTGLGSDAQATARRLLIDMGLWEEERRDRNALHYRLNLPALLRMLMEQHQRDTERRDRAVSGHGRKQEGRAVSGHGRKQTPAAASGHGRKLVSGETNVPNSPADTVETPDQTPETAPKLVSGANFSTRITSQTAETPGTPPGNSTNKEALDSVLDSPKTPSPAGQPLRLGDLRLQGGLLTFADGQPAQGEGGRKIWQELKNNPDLKGLWDRWVKQARPDGTAVKEAQLTWFLDSATSNMAALRAALEETFQNWTDLKLPFKFLQSRMTALNVTVNSPAKGSGGAGGGAAADGEPREGQRWVRNGKPDEVVDLVFAQRNAAGKVVKWETHRGTNVTPSELKELYHLAQ